MAITLCMGCIIPQIKVGKESVILPHIEQSNEYHSAVHASNIIPADEGDKQQVKCKRAGKGSHILPVIRKCLLEPENWKYIQSKQDYHFPGTITHNTEQNLYVIPDITQLEQCSADNPHFLWNDIQFSKGPLNKDRLIEVKIDAPWGSYIYTPTRGKTREDGLVELRG